MIRLLTALETAQTHPPYKAAEQTYPRNQIWKCMAGVPGGSIDPYKLEVFMQCCTATVAWNRAHEKLMNLPPSNTGQQMAYAFSAVGDLQAFLGAAGILSDLFFPNPQRGDNLRGQTLCDLYDVKTDSPLANKRVRNSFVHVDERLDEWLPTQAGKSVGPFAILQWDGPAPPPGQAQHLRIVDTKNWRIIVRGEPLELTPLLQEIDRIGRTFPLDVTGPDGMASLRFERPVS